MTRGVSVKFYAMLLDKEIHALYRKILYCTIERHPSLTARSSQILIFTTFLVCPPDVNQLSTHHREDILDSCFWFLLAGVRSFRNTSLSFLDNYPDCSAPSNLAIFTKNLYSLIIEFRKSSVSVSNATVLSVTDTYMVDFHFTKPNRFSYSLNDLFSSLSIKFLITHFNVFPRILLPICGCFSNNRITVAFNASDYDFWFSQELIVFLHPFYNLLQLSAIYSALYPYNFWSLASIFLCRIL